MLLSIPPDHGLIYGIILYGIGLLILAMIIRMFASWFGLEERFAFFRFLAKITDPFITPIRRFVPRIGIIDVSFIIGFVLLGVLQILLVQALPVGW
ncbi:MAG TPA: YggT family protein [Ktedonobacteraceae bacterium]|jgi:YggT family protein|nr:YggT family protein [Ktedonobacteraceae bacterium]